MSPELNSLSFRDLGYIVAVARESHFRKAAESCYVSQPTLSAQVKKVERVLGAKIFDRSSRGVRLTDTGRRIVEQAALVLDEAEKMALLVHQRKPLVGALSIGVLGTIGPYLLPLVMPALELEFPELSLYIVEGMTEDLADKLRQGKLDLLIASRSPLLEGFGETHSFFERFMLCTNSRERIARRKLLRLADLGDLKMLYLGPGHCLADQASGFCSAAGAERSPFQAASLETLRLLVAAGRGAALVPELAVGGATVGDGGLLSYLPFREKRVGRDVSIYHRSNSAFSEDAAILARIIAGRIARKKQITSPVSSANL